MTASAICSMGMGHSRRIYQQLIMEVQLIPTIMDMNGSWNRRTDQKAGDTHRVYEPKAGGPRK